MHSDIATFVKIIHATIGKLDLRLIDNILIRPVLRLVE